jgi:hypothetical protein
MTIEDLNKRTNDFDGCDLSNYDLWEMMKDPGPMKKEELKYSRDFLSVLGIDPEDTSIISFYTTSTHLSYLADNILRGIQ